MKENIDGMESKGRWDQKATEFNKVAKLKWIFGYDLSNGQKKKKEEEKVLVKTKTKVC